MGFANYFCMGPTWVKEWHAWVLSGTLYGPHMDYVHIMRPRWVLQMIWHGSQVDLEMGPTCDLSGTTHWPHNRIPLWGPDRFCK